jgi:small subunit ribosomal protein S17
MAEESNKKDKKDASPRKDESPKTKVPASKGKDEPKEEAPKAPAKGPAKPIPKAAEKKEQVPKVKPVAKAEESLKAAPKKELSAAAKQPPAKQPAKKKPVKPRKPIPKGMDIGVDVELPKKECKDRFCPFHGSLPVRGQILEGIVVSDRMQRSVVVRREYMRLNKKYERLEKRSGKYLAHSSPCLEAKTGDRVRIMECRPLSKTISYVVIENRS